MPRRARKAILLDLVTGKPVWQPIGPADVKAARQARLKRLENDWVSKEDLHATLIDARVAADVCHQQELRSKVVHAVKLTVARDRRRRSLAAKHEYDRGRDAGLEVAAKVLEAVKASKEDRVFLKALATRIRSKKEPPT